MNRGYTYLDYAASAPIRAEVLRKVHRLESLVFGNAASTHRAGQLAQNLVDDAKAEIAGVLNCLPSELVFTSGGTEADNLSIKGVFGESSRGHIVTTAFEHKAVLDSCRRLERQGISVTYLKPSTGGVISPGQIKEAIRDNTVLVSVMYVNSETGMIQPIAKIGEIIEIANRERKEKILFHTDAVQAASLLNLDVKTLGVDLMSLSAHKLGGHKGVGCLYVREGTDIDAMFDGGGQQHGLRSGTVNTTGCVSMAEALKVSQAHKTREVERLTKLQNYLVAQLKQIDGIVINGDMHHRIASITNISVPQFSADQLVVGCDLNGIAISAGSACSSASIEPSYVLESMGLAPELTRSAVRISMGFKTRVSDINKIISVLKKLTSTQ